MKRLWLIAAALLVSAPALAQMGGGGVSYIPGFSLGPSGVDVYVYGATGNGVVDDRAAIQKAIDAVPLTGGVLNFRPGSTYAIGAAGLHFTNYTNLEVNFNGAQFQALADSTQNDNVGGFATILFTNCTNCRVHGGNYDGKTFKASFLAFTGCTDDEIYSNYSTNVGSTASYQFGSNNSTRLRWHDNVAASPTGGSAVRGFWLGNSNVGFIDTDTMFGPNNKAISNTATGFVFEAAGAQVFGNYALNNAGAGFISSTATGSQSVDHNFVGNTAIGNTFHGYQTDIVSSVPILRLSLVGNRFEGNAAACMYLNFAQFFSVTGNLCLNNDTVGPNQEITVLGTSNQGSITGNTILANSSANAGGINFSAAITSTYTDISITGNNVTCGGTAQGVAIQAITANSTTVKRLVISDNVVSTCATGISLRATAAGDVWDDISVIGNTINNMGTAFLKFTSSTANQITKVRAIGNSGGISLDANTVLIENFGNTWNVALTAPTISSGFGTSPSVTQNNGYRSFSVNVGTGGTASTGAVGLPAAAHGWACTAADVTTPTGDLTQQTGSTTTTASFTNYVRTTGVAGAWTASDILQISCNPN